MHTYSMMFAFSIVFQNSTFYEAITKICAIGKMSMLLVNDIAKIEDLAHYIMIWLITL